MTPLWDQRKLMPDLTGDLVLDIAGLSFVDSTGLGLFVTLHKTLESVGKRLIVFSPTPMARRILEISSLDVLLHIEPPLRNTTTGPTR